jgi:antitoxin CptB
VAQLTRPMQDMLDDRALSRLKWRCRRGMLENDLLIERFFARHPHGLSVRQGRGLHVLMELADNDLLDLLLARCELPSDLDRPEVREVLALLRASPLKPSAGENAPC